MKLQNIVSSFVSLVMLLGLGFFIYYVKYQSSLLKKQNDIAMEELREMKIEAQKLNSEFNPKKNQKVSKEERQKALIYIEKCINEGNCLFQLRGEATNDPNMTFIVLSDIWYSFGENHIEILRQMLKSKINEASINPEYYVSIPSTSSFYPIAIDNVKNTKSYSIILSHGLSPQNTLYVDETILTNF